MVEISIIIEKDFEKCYASTRRVYVLTVFDTNRKSFFQHQSTEKGHKKGASEAPHLFDASFGSPFSVYSVRSAGCGFRIYLPCKIGCRGIINIYIVIRIPERNTAESFPSGWSSIRSSVLIESK